MIGRIAIGKLSPGDVERVIMAARAKGLADETVRLVHATLRSALTTARRWRIVHDNVAKLIEPIPVRRDEVQPFTEDEIDRLLAGAEKDRLGAFVTVALALGLRPGEARALTWDDVDLEGPIPALRVRQSFHRAPVGEELGRPKTARSRRTVVLPAQCVDALRGHRASQRAESLRAGASWRDHNLVFCSPTGGPISESGISRWFARIAKKADVEGHRLYDCRHTAASLLLVQGVHPRVVMEVLGHSTFRLTMDTYSHVMPATLVEAARATELALERITARRTGRIAKIAGDELGVKLGVKPPSPQASDM